jgi:hypothetical protein
MLNETGAQNRLAEAGWGIYPEKLRRRAGDFGAAPVVVDSSGYDPVACIRQLRPQTVVIEAFHAARRS